MHENLTVKKLKEILENYDDNDLVVIEHVEGYSCPNVVEKIIVRPVIDGEQWYEYRGEYTTVDTTPDNSIKAINLTVRD